MLTVRRRVGGGRGVGGGLAAGRSTIDHCNVQSGPNALDNAYNVRAMKISNSHWVSGPYVPAPLGLSANLTLLYAHGRAGCAAAGHAATRTGS